MREILFRGKRLDNGELVEGWYQPETTITHYDGRKEKIGVSIAYKREDGFLDDTFVSPSTVGQYTGLKDKNGKRIFEWDICRFREWNNGDMCWFGKVHYEHQQFMISGGPNKECGTPFHLVLSRFVPENIEVIGNIHDNPELLKGGEG